MIALLWLAVLACGQDGVAPVAAVVPEPMPVEAVMPATPALPEDAWFQLYRPEGDRCYRITQSGGWYVGSSMVVKKEAPVGRWSPGAAVLTAESQARLRQALDAAGFFSLPAQLDTPAPQGVSRAEPVATTWVVSARGPDGAVHTVTATGSLGDAASLGALSGVLRSLDDEALGGWMRE